MRTVDDFLLASQSQNFTIEATITDESDQSISGRAAVVVHQVASAPNACAACVVGQ